MVKPALAQVGLVDVVGVRRPRTANRARRSREQQPLRHEATRLRLVEKRSGDSPTRAAQLAATRRKTGIWLTPPLVQRLAAGLRRDATRRMRAREKRRVQMEVEEQLAEERAGLLHRRRAPQEAPAA